MEIYEDCLYKVFASGSYTPKNGWWLLLLIWVLPAVLVVLCFCAIVVICKCMISGLRKGYKKLRPGPSDILQ